MIVAAPSSEISRLVVTRLRAIDAELPIFAATDDLALFESLRELRKRLAEEGGVPPYVVFGDAALVEMSLLRPADDSEFLRVNGVGQVKLQRYGRPFLAAIAEHCDGRAGANGPSG